MKEDKQQDRIQMENEQKLRTDIEMKLCQNEELKEYRKEDSK